MIPERGRVDYAAIRRAEREASRLCPNAHRITGLWSDGRPYAEVQESPKGAVGLYFPEWAQ